MKSKKKLIIALSSFAFVLVAAVVTVTAVLAAANQAITSNVSVVYTAKQVAGTVTASYKVGTSGSETYMGSITYEGDEAENLSKVLEPNATVELEAKETDQGVTVDPVIFTFTFTNTGSAAYTATLTYTDADEDDANLEMTTSANLKSNAITIPANTTTPIVVTLTVNLQNVALNGEFSGSFKWDLAAQNQ